MKKEVVHGEKSRPASLQVQIGPLFLVLLVLLVPDDVPDLLAGFRQQIAEDEADEPPKAASAVLLGQAVVVGGAHSIK